jgi:AbiV family abortive infection protein
MRLPFLAICRRLAVLSVVFQATNGTDRAATPDEIRALAGKIARAYALAELGAEELGKVLMLAEVGAKVGMGGGVVAWTDFWDDFGNHGRKAWQIAWFNYIVEHHLAAYIRGDIDTIAADETGRQSAATQAEIMVALRECALYVDFDKDQVKRPQDRIRREWAEMMVGVTSELSATMQQHGLAPTKGQLREWFKEVGRRPELRQHAYDLRRRVNRLRAVSQATRKSSRRSRPDGA